MATLSRDQKIEKAKELREQGQTYEAIASALGITGSCVQKWLKPEWAKRQAAKSNGKRKAYKRQWQEDHRASCPECGSPLCQGSRTSSTPPTSCQDCYESQRRSQRNQKIVRFIELRREGLTNAEIERRDKLPFNTVAKLLWEAKKEGFDVPPPPYWSRKNSPAVAA